MQSLDPSLKLLLLESGGVNLFATSSPKRSGLTLYMIDASASDEVPCKGGSKINEYGLTIIYKINIIENFDPPETQGTETAKILCGKRRIVFINLYEGLELDTIIRIILERRCLP